MRTKKYVNLVCLLFFMLCTTGVYAQTTITGQVTDENGEPLIGANVIIKGTTTGTVTDADGNYAIEASTGKIIVYSFTGYLNQEMTVGNSATINVILEADIGILNEIVVSSTRTPIRKIQSTTAINSIGLEEMSVLQPETFSEAIQNTPGITINEAQGRKGGFNIRGFPTGNIYTTTLIDGLPASAFAGLSSGTQEFYGLDQSVERIEVVRGAAATLFGRSASAGAVNIISKTGGITHKGSFSLTKYNNNARKNHQFDDDVDYRVDVNFNGPISDKLRYNIGGYLINDSGAKEQAHKDQGAQIRTNIDWLISEGSKIRFSLGYLRNNFQNVTDVPWDLGRNEIGAGFTSRNTFFNDARQLDGDRIFASQGTPLLDVNGNRILRNPADYKERAWGGNFAVDGTFDLGNNWSANVKLKYQNFNWDDINEIGLSGFYNENSSIFRFLASSIMDNQSFITEARVSKQINAGNAVHNISGGLFYSNGNRDRLGINYSYFSTVSPRPTFSGFGGSPLSDFTSNSATTSHREEKTTGIFIGDEMVFNEKLSVNVAVRYDWFDAVFTNNPGEINSTGVDFDPAPDQLIEIDESFGDFSGSIGANYLFGESSAIYANFLRAFSLPLVTTRTFTKPEDNEIINNFELGYRAGLGDLTVDATLFSTRINNRVSLQLNSQTVEFEPRSAGTNKILGGELALTYAPRAVTGLLIRGNVTLQNSEYVDFNVPLSVNRAGTATNVDQEGNLFGLNIIGSGLEAAIDVAGNQVQRIPNAIYNFNIGYSSDRWGANFGGFTYTGIYADATNLFEQPNLSAYNLGGYIAFPFGENELKFSMRIKNLFNSENPQELLLSSGDDAALRERQLNPVSPEGRLAFTTIQNPRRILFTVAYSF